MEVTLIKYTCDGVKLIADAVRVTGPFFEKMEDADLVRYMVKHDYGSVLEHVVFTFELKDISIAISRELLEHRIASHTARSTRYSDEGDASFYYPEFSDEREKEVYTQTLKYVQEQYLQLRDRCGYEVARYLLPMATHCTYTWTINARSLINFLRLRLCKTAAPEMQELARNVKDLVDRIYPEVFETIGCRGSQYGICPEPKRRSCGKYPTQRSSKDGQ
jgi:thymidylate synthase (FAD)